MIDPATDTTFRAFAADRKYGPATLERWSRLQPHDAAALLHLVQELRPSENQLRDLWDRVDEIAARDRLTPAHVLALEPIPSVWRRHLGRNDKLKLLKGSLRRLRFPQLTATEERLAKLIDTLGLPRQVHLILPEFLEGDTLRIEITANSAAALRTAVEALRAAAATPTCDQLFALLAEAE